MNAINPDRKILWKQVGGLASMLAAIIFCWMAYEFYQPQILRNLGFLELAAWLGVIQGILAAGVEPVVGGLSDRIMRVVGNRLPIIAVGVTLAGAIFAIVSGLLDRNLPEGIRWLVPALMTLWVIAMIVFRGPAIAILQQLAPTEALPQANALLVFVFALTGACHPMINLLLKNVGAGATFIVGALVLLVGAILLWASSPKRLTMATQAFPQAPASVLSMVLTFAIGIGAGIEVNLMMAVVPKVLSQGSLLNLSSEYIASLILLIAAIATFPIGHLITKLGSRSGMVFGLFAVAAGIAMTLIRPAIFGQNIIFEISHILIAGIAFSLVFTSMIPFALSMLSNEHAGLATGLYFGGGGLATALLNGISQYLGSQLDRVETETAVLVAFVTLPIAIGCIAAKHNGRSPISE
jgi:MFS family permease